MTTRAEVLAKLRSGPQTSYSLGQTTYRYGARLYELRKEGFEISTEMHRHPHTRKVYAVYTLLKEPEGER